MKNADTQQMVNKMFAKQIGRSMEIYVDNMLVKSKKSNSHIADLSKAFEVLCDYQMKLNPSKCLLEFHQTNSLSLWLINKVEKPTQRKFWVVLDMKTPTNLKKLE